jgi:Activator of Hsp90 ATPase homolog 1-like protein
VVFFSEQAFSRLPKPISQPVAAAAAAQGVRNTSYATKTGERVLRIETIVPASVEQVWHAWTTQDGLKEWIAPVATIDLKVGGTISTNYDGKARIGDPRHHPVADRKLH